MMSIEISNFIYFPQEFRIIFTIRILYLKKIRQKHIFTLKICFYHVDDLAFPRNRNYYPTTVKFLGETF